MYFASQDVKRSHRLVARGKCKRILGDVQAIEKGPTAVVERAERKWLWRLFGRLFRRA